MSNIFKKADIKAGYLLRVKAGDEEINMTVVPTKAHDAHPVARLVLGHISTADGDLACCGAEGWFPLSQFNDDLKTEQGEQVVAVYGYTCPKYLLANSTDERERLWERKEDKPEPAKKMTVAEIAEALGYPVEIAEG